MKKNTFDVLIVYTEAVAKSAADKTYHDAVPFPHQSNHAHYNDAYAYFLTTCAGKKLSVAFTTTKDIRGSGTCSSFWSFAEGVWEKHQGLCFAPLIFDKFSPVNEMQQANRTLLFSTSDVIPFNSHNLMEVFFDKLLTFQTVSEFSIPTIEVLGNTVGSITNSVHELKKIVLAHPHKHDFSTHLILKDRYGAGGIDIYKIQKDFVQSIKKIMNESPSTSYILQPFVKFNHGYHHGNNTSAATDIRLIYDEGTLKQCYIRTAAKNDFRCNEHQGGSIVYIKRSEIPLKIRRAAHRIQKSLVSKNSVYALDFIMSNNGNVYFLEGNMNPGVYWGIGDLTDELHTKKLIRLIISRLAFRIKNSKTEIVDSLIPVPNSLTLPLLNLNKTMKNPSKLVA